MQITRALHESVCAVLSLCAPEVSSYIPYLYIMYSKASRWTITVDYVPSVIQTACSWGERLLLCPSPGIPGRSRVSSVPCFSWVWSYTSTPCSSFFDPDSQFTSFAISVYMFTSSSEGCYGSSTSSNISCTSLSSSSAMLTNKQVLCSFCQYFRLLWGILW